MDAQILPISWTSTSHPRSWIKHRRCSQSWIMIVFFVSPLWVNLHTFSVTTSNFQRSQLPGAGGHLSAPFPLGASCDVTTLSAFILLCISFAMCCRYYSLFSFSFVLCCHEVFWSLVKQLASCTIFAVCILFCVANYDASAESREVCLLEQRVNSVSVLKG